MNKTITVPRLPNVVFWVTLLCIPAFLVANYVQAQVIAEDFSVSVRNMTAEVTFTTATPCVEYELAWGDGEQTVKEDESDVCIQVLDLR